jgi:glycosyltransferase involved in cell wall biosynthesis
MIVRDEAIVLPRLAASLAGLIDSWTICDTGSQDGTPEQVQELFDAIPGQLLHHQWVNYGANRSLALAAARGTADYLLLLDADQTIVQNGPLPDLCADAYMVRMEEEAAHWLPKLIRGDLAWRFDGAAHEYLSLDRAYTQQPLEQLVVCHGGDGGNRPGKFERELQLLQGDLERHPDDRRTIFYLAQTMRDLGRIDEAISLYRRRAELGGWDEEVFYAKWQIGRLLVAQGAIGAEGELLDAWAFRPSRAESLHDLTVFYRNAGKHRLAHHFASLGREIAIPADILFVHRWIYDWGLDFEWAIAAYWLGDFGGAAAVNDELLAMDLPDAYRQATEKNQEFCRAALAQRGGADAQAVSSAWPSATEAEARGRISAPAGLSAT